MRKTLWRTWRGGDAPGGAPPRETFAGAQEATGGASESAPGRGACGVSARLRACVSGRAKRAGGFSERTKQYVQASGEPSDSRVPSAAEAGDDACPSSAEPV